MTARQILPILAALLLLLGGEILVARLHVNVLAAPLVGLVMAAIVCMSFMRLAMTGGLPRVFALAALFWLTVLLGMGSLDAITRNDVGIGSGVVTDDR